MTLTPQELEMLTEAEQKSYRFFLSAADDYKKLPIPDQVSCFDSWYAVYEELARLRLALRAAKELADAVANYDGMSDTYSEMMDALSKFRAAERKK